MFTNPWSFIFAWYNLPFTFLLGLGLLLAVLQLIGLGGDADGEADAEADFDHEVELESEVDLDHELDSDLEGEADADAEAEIEAATPSPFSWLAFIGAGKAPLLVVVLILFGAIGIAGWVMNGLLQRLFGTYPGLAFIGVLPVTVVIAGWVSSRIARFIGQALPPLSTTATNAQALVGRRGVVISPFVDDHYGLVHLRNAGGTLISVFAVTRAEATLKRGEPVVLVVYDDQQRQYQVTRAQAVLEPP